MLKKAIFIFVSLAVLSFPCMAGAQSAAPSISARSAVVVSAADGRVLYEKNSHERLPIASTTKIMTALLTLEAAARGDRTVLITPEMVRVEGSSMGLKAGDKLTLTSLAEGMLSVSGNDAANSAAIAVGGSVQKFAALMNQKAAQLGLSDTHYVTPSGLDNNEHYSSAGDLAKLTAAALKNSEFARIVAQKKIKVRFSEPDRTVTYTNHNKLLSMYDGCTGVKTGFTKKSGRCLVSAAERGGVQLVAVTLSDPNDWEDHERLLDYGFSRLTRYQADDSGFRLNLPVVGGEANSVLVEGSAGNAALFPAEEVRDLRRTVELPQFVYAPVSKGQVLGLVRYSNDAGTIATTKLTAGAEVPRQIVQKSIWGKLWARIRELLSA